MQHTAQPWRNLVFYGEVVGFAAAWVVGFVVLTQSRTPEPRLASGDGLAHAEVGLSDRLPEELK